MKKALAFVMILLVVASSLSIFTPQVKTQNTTDISIENKMEPSVDDWPMFRHDLRHTGYSTSTAPNTNNTLWTYTTGGSVVASSPSVVGGKLYIGCDDVRKIYCLNASTGSLIWSYTTEAVPSGVPASSPAVANGRVYIGAFDKRVYCLNASTGALIWKYTTGAYVASSPAVVDGRVFVGEREYGNKVYCLNATTGALIWSYATGMYVESSPAVSGGVVYIGSNDHKVYALNATTGARIWSYATGNEVPSSPAVVDGKVFVGSLDTKVYCLNASTGALIWSYKTGGCIHSSPAVADSRVFIGSKEYDYRVYCLDASTGALIWSYKTESNVGSSPAVADGKVYVGSNDDYFYCLNMTTGELVWRYRTGGVIASSPAVAEGKVFIASFDGKVYCFGEKAKPDFTISASPLSQTINPGQSTTYTVTLTSINGFSSEVSLSGSINPSSDYISLSFDPESVTPPSDGSVESTLTVSTTSEVTPDTYTIMITGTSEGKTHSTDVTLIILALPPTPTDKTAVLVLPFYSAFNNPKLASEISEYLQDAGYSCPESSIIRDEDVTVSFLRSELSQGVIFWMGHGAWSSIYGSCLATSEKWTNDAEVKQKYPDDYDNLRITKITIDWPHPGFGDWIAITPKFIDYYYETKQFPHSLVYIEACESLKDNSMALAFTNYGAGAYIGYTGDISSLIEDSTSIQAFYDLCKKGYTVEQTVKDMNDPWWRRIIPGPNWFGDGDLKLISNQVLLGVIVSPADLYQHLNYDISKLMVPWIDLCLPIAITVVVISVYHKSTPQNKKIDKMLI